MAQPSLYAVGMSARVNLRRCASLQMQQMLMPILLIGKLLLLSGCGDDRSANNAAVTGTADTPVKQVGQKQTHQTEASLNLAFANAVPGLDPLRAGSHETNMMNGGVRDRLYRYALLARPHQLLPQAARSMPEISADGLIYTITLHGDQHFHADTALPPAAQNGRALQAADVVYSLLRHFDPKLQSAWRWLWAGRIQGLDAWSRSADYAQPPVGLQVIDAATLRITLSTPQSDFLHLLAHPSAAIVMHEAVEYHGDNYPLHAIGSGPYRLHDLSLSNITLLAAAQHPGRPIQLQTEGHAESQHASRGLAALEKRTAPMLAAINIVIERDPQQRLQLLRDGHIDALLLEPEQYPQLLALNKADDAQTQVTLPIALASDWSSDWQLSRQPAAQWLRIDFNQRSEALGSGADADRNARHLDLRCALRDSIDWHDFNRRFYLGSGYVTASVIAPLLASPVADATAIAPASSHQDRVATIDALPELVFAHVDSRRNRAHFDWFQQQLTQPGHAPDSIRNETFANLGDLLQAYREQQWPLLFSAWSLDLPTPANTLQLYAGNNAHAANNGPGLANHQNATFDQLLRHLSRDNSDDSDAIGRMLKLLADNCVLSAGFSPARVHVWRKSLLAWPDADFAASEWLRLAAF